MALIALAISAFILTQPPAGLTQTAGIAFALSLAAIALWATAIIPEYLTALLFFCFAMLLKVAPAAVVFGGFESTALWLIFGGLVIGVAIDSSGLGRRVANKVSVHLHGSYLRLIGGIVAVSTLLGFIMPSAMGRVVLLIPVALAMADYFGFGSGSNGRKGIVLAFLLGSFLPGFTILPANVPNMVLAGLAETQHQQSLFYSEYLLLHFPVLGVVKMVLLTALLLWLFPDHPDPRREEGTASKRPFSSQELGLSLLLLLMLSLWMTDTWHHVSPAWVALAGAIVLLLPKVGMVGKDDFNKRINFGSVFFVAGVLGMGGVIAHSGLGDVIAQKILEILPLRPGQDFSNYFSLVLSGTVTGLMTTLPGIPAIMAPIADELAAATQLPLKHLLMMQVISFSTVLLPYTAPPIVVGMQLAGESLMAAVKACLLLALLTFVVLVPLDYLWWKLLGW
jgi:anion transporter